MLILLEEHNKDLSVSLCVVSLSSALLSCLYFDRFLEMNSHVGTIMQVASSAGGCNGYLSVHTPTLNILYPAIENWL